MPTYCIGYTSYLYFLDLYEEENMSDRLIKMEKEWPGAVLQILKLGKLTPVSWSYVSN